MKYKDFTVLLVAEIIPAVRVTGIHGEILADATLLQDIVLDPIVLLVHLEVATGRSSPPTNGGTILLTRGVDLSADKPRPMLK